MTQTLDPPFECDAETRRQFVGLLPMAPQQILQPPEADVGRQFFQVMPILEQEITRALRDFMLEFPQVALKFFARFHDDLSSGRWRGRAHIRDKIRDREIGFVTHSTDDWYRACRNRARHGLFVERPQILDRSAAAREENHVHHFLAVEIFQRRDNFLRRAVALHAHRIQD